jgi:hypothetical protein
MIIAPATTCGLTATRVLQIGGGNNFVVGTTWYKEAALTDVAGTYTASTNTFQATNLAGEPPIRFIFRSPIRIMDVPKRFPSLLHLMHCLL